MWPTAIPEAGGRQAEGHQECCLQILFLGDHLRPVSSSDTPGGLQDSLLTKLSPGCLLLHSDWTQDKPPAATPERHCCSSVRSILHYPLTKYPYKDLDYAMVLYYIQHPRVYLSWFVICPLSFSSLLSLTNAQSPLTELFRVPFFVSSKDPHLKSSLRDFEALLTWWISIPQTHPLCLDFSVFIL